MTFTYAVLGAGRQGTAAAYDMARWGDAQRITLADYDLEVARRAAERVNNLWAGLSPNQHNWTLRTWGRRSRAW